MDGVKLLRLFARRKPEPPAPVRPVMANSPYTEYKALRWAKEQIDGTN